MGGLGSIELNCGCLSRELEEGASTTVGAPNNEGLGLSSFWVEAKEEWVGTSLVVFSVYFMASRSSTGLFW